MYLSHPVRRMRDDPVPDARVELVVTAAADGDRAALASAISQRFDTTMVEIATAVKHDLSDTFCQSPFGYCFANQGCLFNLVFAD